MDSIDAMISPRRAHATLVRWPAWLPGVVAAVAALAVYAVTLHGTYVYDDVILHEDARFTHPAQWSKFWTDQYMPGAVDKLYRPLTCLSFAVEYSLHGDRPWIYHLVNWLLHAGASAAVAEFARRLMGFRVACVAGLLFAVHPVHVEAVAGLVGRAELFRTLATAWAMLLFLKPMTGGRALCILVLLAIAVLSKEQGILLPVFLVVLFPVRAVLVGSKADSPSRHGKLRTGFDIDSDERSLPSQGPPRLRYESLTSDKVKPERAVMRALFAGLCLLTAGYLVFREQMLGFTWDRQQLEWTANPLIRSVGNDRLLMPVVLLGRYLLLLLAPVRLSLDYGTHVIGWTVNWEQPYVYLGALAIGVWCGVLVWMWRRGNRAVSFCLMALSISYGIVSNSIILIGTIFGERLMYLPSVFFLMLVAALLVRLFRPIALTFVVLLLVLAGSARTFTYARLWNDPLALILTDLREYPQSMHLHSLAVDQYLSHGDYVAAREVGRDSIRVLPDCWESYRMVVAADVRMHDWADADAVLAHVDRRCPGLRIAGLAEGVAAAKAESRH